MAGKHRSDRKVRTAFHSELRSRRERWERRSYFQLQFGMSPPAPVRGRRWVPSASMVQMLGVAGAAAGAVGVDDVATVGGPGREVAATAVVGELDPALEGGDLHDVDVLSAGGSGAVLAIPGEGDELAVGRPRGGGGVAAVGEAIDAGAVCSPSHRVEEVPSVR